MKILVKLSLYFVLCSACSLGSKGREIDAHSIIKRDNMAVSSADIQIIENAFKNSGFYKDFDELVAKGFTLFVHPEREHQDIIVLVRGRDKGVRTCGTNYKILVKKVEAVFLGVEGESACGSGKKTQRTSIVGGPKNAICELDSLIDRASSAIFIHHCIKWNSELAV